MTVGLLPPRRLLQLTRPQLNPLALRPRNQRLIALSTPGQ